MFMKFHLLPILLERSNDQSCFPIKPHIIVNPIYKYYGPISKTDKKEKVHEHPNEPCEHSLKAKALDIAYCLVAPDSSHRALVDILKRQ